MKKAFMMLLLYDRYYGILIADDTLFPVVDLDNVTHW